MFDAFVESLQYHLDQPLPGIQAQRKMMPVIDNPGQYKFPSEPENVKRGGVLILIYPFEGEIYFPLMLRNEYDGPHSGQVSLPGGKMEEFDLDIIDTALRESCEEIGVGREDIHVMGTLTDFYVNASNFMVTPVVGYVKTKPIFKPDDFEVKLLIQTTVSNIIDRQIIKHKDFNFSSGYKLNAPYFDVGGHVVWGATAMMLSEFVEIVRRMV